MRAALLVQRAKALAASHRQPEEAAAPGCAQSSDVDYTTDGAATVPEGSSSEALPPGESCTPCDGPMAMLQRPAMRPTGLRAPVIAVQLPAESGPPALASLSPSADEESADDEDTQRAWCLPTA